MVGTTGGLPGIHGGKRHGSGRPPGSRNKFPTQPRPIAPGYGEVAMYAREVTKEAIDFLISVMRDEGVHSALRVHAASGLLDRGYGKPPQATQLQSYQQHNVVARSNEEIRAELLRRGLGPVLGIEEQPEKQN
jgi:hypothetical protein